MKLEIYMKSGNVIKIRGLKNVKFSYSGNEIKSLIIEYFRWWTPRRKLSPSSVDLSQIEAIVKITLF